MTMHKLIIFDLDGTLVDSLDDLTASVNHMLRAFNRPAVSRNDVRGMVGEGARVLVERAMPCAAEDELVRGLELFLSHNEKNIAVRSVPFAGVVATLAELSKAGHVLVVITNKNESLSRTLLQLLGLSGYFRGIYGADTLPSRKPSPAPLLHVMNELGYSAATTLMIGDSINDIAAGNGAGVTTIGCSWGYGSADELIDADWRIDNFADLLKLPPLIDKM